METFKENLTDLYQRLLQEDIDILEVKISELCSSYVIESFDKSIEALFFISIFLLWKSRKLLPKEENKQEVNENEEDIMSQFIEYSRFKELALNLIELEKKQLPHIPREVLFIPEQKESGLEEVSLNDLATIFQKMMAGQPVKKTINIEEEFTVGNKLDWLKEFITEKKRVLFFDLFSFERSKLELISLFLALLELIKLQEIAIIKENDNLLCLKR